MSNNDFSLVNTCLLATPAIKDPLFAASLIYVCEHNENGSMGLVINHQTDQHLDEIFNQLNIECTDEKIRNQPLYIGGPVQLEQGFILHKDGGDWQKTVEISVDIHLTSSVDILEAIAQGKGPSDYLVMLGFSGWSSGQLESELQDNAWLTTCANTDLLFHQKADDKWQVAFDTLGFDISKLSPVTGNA